MLCINSYLAAKSLILSIPNRGLFPKTFPFSYILHQYSLTSCIFVHIDQREEGYPTLSMKDILLPFIMHYMPGAAPTGCTYPGDSHDSQRAHDGH